MKRHQFGDDGATSRLSTSSSKDDDEVPVACGGSSSTASLRCSLLVTAGVEAVVVHVSNDIALFQKGSGIPPGNVSFRVVSTRKTARVQWTDQCLFSLKQ